MNVSFPIPFFKRLVRFARASGRLPRFACARTSKRLPRFACARTSKRLPRFACARTSKRFTRPKRLAHTTSACVLVRLLRLGAACALAALVCACALTLVACDDEYIDSYVASQIEQTDSNETWAIYWYLCGSDLESEYGAATADMEELTSARLSENVQVIVQTGGAYAWYNDVDGDATQRWLCTSSGLELVDEQPQANMGESSTLADFLTFCVENYPADHTVVILWNHGGGTVGGVAYDELYDYDSLSLTELHDAFAEAFELSAENPPIDILGFDACLMGSIDVADMASDVASYLVASQESEPSSGWEYTGWLTGLSRDTGMGAERLGQLICDTYMEGCEITGEQNESTLSVVDLAKMPALVEAYDGVGAEALDYVQQDSTFYAQYARAAERAENYGGNTPSEGYSDMVDLGDLMRNSTNILPETADEVLNLLDEAVSYQVKGAYCANASGLSCYHAYDGRVSYDAYCEVAASDNFEDFYGYSLNGQAPASGLTFTYSEEESTLPSEASNAESLEDFPVELDGEYAACLNLGADVAADLTTVLVHIARYDEAEDLIIDLGEDNDLYADWDTGTFTDNFWGYWGALDGALCYREVVYEGEDYVSYSIPILLNGKECSLSVVYDYNSESYEIQGARPEAQDGSGTMASKYLLPLKEGDEVTMLYYAASLSGDDDFMLYEGNTITVSANTAFEDVDMGDGYFVLYFDMRDGQNNSYLSAPVYFTVEGDDIYVEVD